MKQQKLDRLFRAIEEAIDLLEAHEQDPLKTADSALEDFEDVLVQLRGVYRDVTKVKKLSRRDEFISAMVDAFISCSGVRMPPLTNERYKKSFGVQWNAPLWEMYSMFPKNHDYDDRALKRTVAMIQYVVKQQAEQGLTMSSPNSIIKSARSVYAKHQRRITEQHNAEKKPIENWNETK